MTFLAPYYFWGLLGLLIPLAIHLWSRRNPKVIPFGSIRFLPQSEASRSMSLKLTEKGLLLLRMAILALLVLIVCYPVIKQSGQFRHWILLDPAVSDLPAVRQLLDTTDQEVRYLANDFPLAENTLEDPGIQDHWQLVSEASALADSLTVIDAGRITRFTGARPALPVPVTWITLDNTIGDKPWEVPLYQGKSGQSYRLSFTSSSGYTSVKKVEAPEELPPADTMRISFHGVMDESQETYITTAFTSLADYLDIPVRFRENEVQAGWHIAMSDASVPADVTGKVLIFVPRRPGVVLIPTEDPDRFLINGNLDPGRIRDEQVMESLLEIADPYATRLDDELKMANDQRSMPFDTTPQMSGVQIRGKQAREAVTWPLWIALFVLIFTERVLAYRKYA